MRLDTEGIFSREPAPLETCPHCKKRPLWSTDERELRICNQCADREYERYTERNEWHHYHPR